MVSDTIEFRHRKLTLPSVTPEDKVIHGVQQITEALKNTPASTLDAQLQAIKSFQDTIEHWAGGTKSPTSTTDLPRLALSTRKHQAPRVIEATPSTPPDPRVQAPPRVRPISTEDIPSNHQPIAQRLHSQLEPNKLEPETVTEQPVAHPTRYQTTQQALMVQPVLAAQRKYPAKLINLWFTPRPEEYTAMPVLDN